MQELDNHWLTHDPALAWRPRSLPRPVRHWVDRRLRLPILTVIAAVHVLTGVWLLADRLEDAQGDDIATSLLIEFITRVPEPVLEPSEIIVIRPPAATIEPMRPPRQAPSPTMTVLEIPTAVAEDAPPLPETRLRLFDADGEPLVPEDLLDQVDRSVGDKRDFAYQVPKLDALDKLLSRPDALPYEATRFESGWQPDQDLLTAMLEKAVEKTTVTVKIPVPGRPGSKLVCKVVVLAAGGGCGVERNSDGYQVVLNDPNTLNEEEQQQCQAWWDKITSASSQDIWRKTRALYDAECRKPPERKVPEPLP